MKKLFTAAVAGTVGIALLLGGAGTFALWTSTATVSTPTITAGDLDLTAGTAGVWKEGSTTIDPSTYLIIPGKTLTFTQNLTIDAQGNGLQATLAPSTLAGTGDLYSLMTKSLALTSSATSNVTINNSTNVVTFAAPGSYTVTATLTVTLPSTVTAGQDGTLDLNDITFTLTQKI